MQNFPDCISHVLAAEGGLVNDPKDPGGVTKFGISQRSYPALDIRALSLDEAKAIYQRDYWAPIQGERLPAGLDLLVLDHAVNAGPFPAGLTGSGAWANVQKVDALAGRPRKHRNSASGPGVRVC